MKIASPIILIFCGIIALVGVFLPWASSITGWEAFMEYGLSTEADTVQVFLVFIGSILLLITAIPVAFVSANPESSKRIVMILSILASIGAAVGVAGASWFLSSAIRWESIEFLEYGYYMSFGATVLALIFGIIESIRASARV